MKVSLGTCMKCLGEICFILTMLFLFLFIDFLLVMFGYTIYDKEIKSVIAALIIIIYYGTLVIGVLFLHGFALLTLIDAFNYQDNIAKKITNLIYRKKKKPCVLCLSLPICQEQRVCNDLEVFNFKRERCFYKIRDKLGGC